MMAPSRFQKQLPYLLVIHDAATKQEVSSLYYNIEPLDMLTTAHRVKSHEKISSAKREHSGSWGWSSLSVGHPIWSNFTVRSATNTIGRQVWPNLADWDTYWLTIITIDER